MVPTKKYKQLLRSVKNKEDGLVLLKEFYNKCKDIETISQTFNSSTGIIIKYLIELDIYGKKFCNKCNIWKLFSEFAIDNSRSAGLKGQCKLCCQKSVKNWSDNNKDHRKEYSDNYIIENKDKLKEYQQIWYENTKDIRQKNAVEYYHNNKEERLQYQKDRMSIEENRQKRREWQVNYNKENISQKFRMIFSSRIGQILKQNGSSKMGGSISNYLPYTMQELIDHLESKFQPGMTLENHGFYGWHIDHIKPISKFNIISMDCDDFQECWSLSNLQPLWWQDNLSKSDYYENEFEEDLTIDELLSL